MEGVELQCFKIISSVGTARSSYIEAIQEAKKGDFVKAEELMKEGIESFNQGHCTHGELIQEEANGNGVTASLLLIHAEDQLMSAEAFHIIANELIDSYKRITALEKK
ncbi:MAG: PTS lactose/cellobiose transporter subunit IIA [Longicatena sp.]|uniref:PTS lactose/cellobiose transporter subunit IIA n=1 Tax=Anaerorhabdus sp. TaxID=1872524 RepID=UPI002FC5E4D2